MWTNKSTSVLFSKVFSARLFPTQPREYLQQHHDVSAEVESHVDGIGRKQGNKAGQCPKWWQKDWQSPCLGPHPPVFFREAEKMRYEKERRKEVKRRGKQAGGRQPDNYMPLGGRIWHHLWSSLAKKKLNLSLIKTLDFFCYDHSTWRFQARFQASDQSSWNDNAA